jgi:hypothetical protein
MWKSPEDWEAIQAAVEGAMFNLVLLTISAVWAISRLRHVHLSLGR